MSPTVLQAHAVAKSFNGLPALVDAGLTLRAGEVHVLMGQNGAGKSTLIKILTGVQGLDAGDIQLDGRPFAARTPLQAQQAGIAVVHQEVQLCPNLSVAENLLAGRLPRRWWGIAWKQARVDAEAALARLGLQLDVRQTLGDLPVALQQMVAIARALHQQARVLILDEPTSSLDEAETARLLALLRQLRGEGVAILLVTHFLDQAYAVADRFTVLRNGELVGEYSAELPRMKLVQLMIGRELSATTVARDDAAPPAGAALLQTQGLGRRHAVEGVSLSVAPGEVLGLAGLLGAGRTETARLLFGADRADMGELRIDGRPLTLAGPRDAIRAGFAFCPEERKVDGIVAALSVRENIVLALQARRGVFRMLSPTAQRELAQRFITQLGIKTADAETPIGLLSGGNQQKAILARWLATEPRLLILDEPTRGIDIAAKQDLMDQVLTLCRQGMALVFISSELPEVLRACDRVIVLRERRQVAELPARGLSESQLLHAMAEAA
ncbi:sugar ABC transporter ATP-binding protein [Roseateles asaccharophilus]|uniref:Simple sugar transport system ATP-binding protein n=1 Tax=Roseateles asaccharophilus TaxID=582607 RepID=A0ABU2AFD8_9BURK|nr:sugar ABC transporter ATP-binding protein [Roseateles asaccharophilus]MDR7335323.1 simple sugar transport system ATP-binding protein [Roseateles asaccharophilus]